MITLLLQYRALTGTNYIILFFDSQAQRIVVKDDIEEWKGSRSLSIIVAEETAVPHAPSTTVGYSTTVRTGSSSPPVTKSSPASSSVSTALIISGKHTAMHYDTTARVR